jgi:hypothetical protein
VDIKGVLQPDTVNDPANWQLVEAGPDGMLDTPDDVVVPITLSTTTGTPYMVGTNRITIQTGGPLPPGLYRFRMVSGGLADPFGQPLNGDGGGGDLVRDFYVTGGDAPGGGYGPFAPFAPFARALTPADPNPVSVPGPDGQPVFVPVLGRNDGLLPQTTAEPLSLPATSPAAQGRAWDDPLGLGGRELDPG